MTWSKIKCLFTLYFLVISISARWIPLIRESTSITDDAYRAFDKEAFEDATVFNPREQIAVQEITDVQNRTNRNENRIEARNELVSNNVRPGQTVFSYSIILSRDGANIHGKALLDVRLSDQTIGNVMKLHIMGLNIHRVQVGVMSDVNLQDADFGTINNILEIRPKQGQASSYIVIVEYTLPLRNDGKGIFLGVVNDEEYIAMNLHPVNARRVFPCMDEPSLLSTGLTFTFNDMGFNTIISNTQRVGDTTQFRPIQGPVHRWAMIAHNMNIINNPVPNLVTLSARNGVNNQETQASLAINNYYYALNSWTSLNHSDMILDQDGALHVMAVPDISRDWYGLSTLIIWEPYILMENNNAVKQRKTALMKIAEGMARQWFGWLIFPENWRDQWVIAGLGNYAANEVVKDFQTPPPHQEDESLLDMNTIFTTDTIQESLLHDSYAGAEALRPNENLYNENAIRQHTLGLLQIKAPALLRMTRLVLSRQTDLVQTAAQGLLRSRRSQWVTTRSLYDGLNSGYGTPAGSGLIDGSVEDFLRPWVENSGYPVVTVELRSGGVSVQQERFGLSARPQISYTVPLSYTTGVNPNFNDLFPREMLQTNLPIDIPLGEDDWVIFNVQGQGYYRVNYDSDLWERLIDTLSDEETREDIHPLNRASLLDDSLNLARAGRLDYDVAFEMALTMELETEYAVWKAFIRNMDFIRKFLIPFVEEEDDDIYLRMVRRAIVEFEEEIGFEPEGVEPAMLSLTRGLVMEHACKAGYEPCIAAAVDFFYHPNNEEEVNPNIPHEIRPAVYCTMLRESEEEDEEEVIEALQNHLDGVQSRYERLVILESLACAKDNGFINSLLQDTIADESPYVLEERTKVFAAVASSSFDNSMIALNFLIRNTQQIRDMYGGPEKLEEAIFVMADNIVTVGQTNDFRNWINSLNSNLDDSREAAQRQLQRIQENLDWADNHLEDIYEWIDENDASTVFVSTALLCLSMFIVLFNQH